jgi:hypothetical protein
LSSEIFELIKKIYLDPELKSNKELGGEYWMKSNKKHMTDNEIVNEYIPVNNTITFVNANTINVDMDDYVIADL